MTETCEDSPPKVGGLGRQCNGFGTLVQTFRAFFVHPARTWVIRKAQFLVFQPLLKHLPHFEHLYSHFSNRAPH